MAIKNVQIGHKGLGPTVRKQERRGEIQVRLPNLPWIIYQLYPSYNLIIFPYYRAAPYTCNTAYVRGG